MRPGSSPVIATAAALSLLAGCGGGGYANLSRHAARKQALAALETADPRSALYGHRLEVLSMTKSHDAAGRTAWRVVVADRTEPLRLCVYTRRSGGDAQTGVSACGSAPIVPPPGLGGSGAP